ncbi:MAG: thioredoxin family protein [Xenococcaceae cyanobacterium]
MSGNLSESQNQGSNNLRNILIAIVAIVLSVAIFLGLQTETNSASLETQAERSIPLDVAIANGKPTLTEFYADWCTTCQAMAKDLAQVKQKYANSVNFVMLNVDNTKWLPEVMRYRVDGIPHFVYMDKGGVAIAQTIGEQPLPILEANLDALSANNPLPYASASGRISQFQAKATQTQSAQDDPRSHGSQVQ